MPDHPAASCDITAEITYLQTSEGGRKSGVQSGTWAHFHYQKGTWHVWLYFDGTPWAFPGETLEAGLLFKDPLAHLDRVHIGMRFELVEGARVVAHGRVKGMLALSANAESLRIRRARESPGKAYHVSDLLEYVDTAPTAPASSDN